MNFILSGYRGYIGSKLLDYLKNSEIVKKIYLIDYKFINDESVNDKIIPITLSFTEDDSKLFFDKIDIFYHLASKNSNSKNNFEYTNIHLTKYFYDLSKKIKCSKFIFFSSILVSDYKFLGKKAYLSKYLNYSKYITSKIEAEKNIINNSAQEKDYLILRLPMVVPRKTKLKINFFLIPKHKIYKIIIEKKYLINFLTNFENIYQLDGIITPFTVSHVEIKDFIKFYNKDIKIFHIPNIAYKLLNYFLPLKIFFNNHKFFFDKNNFNSINNFKVINLKKKL